MQVVQVPINLADFFIKVNQTALEITVFTYSADGRVVESFVVNVTQTAQTLAQLKGSALVGGAVNAYIQLPGSSYAFMIGSRTLAGGTPSDAQMRSVNGVGIAVNDPLYAGGVDSSTPISGGPLSRTPALTINGGTFTKAPAAANAASRRLIRVVNNNPSLGIMVRFVSVGATAPTIGAGTETIYAASSTGSAITDIYAGPGVDVYIANTSGSAGITSTVIVEEYA